jgi:ATP-dependent DNA helicase RecQ
VLHYIKEEKTCKSKLLLDYFGEKIKEDCGVCSYCISKKKKKNKTDTSTLSEKIIGLLKIQEMNSRDIQKLTKYPKDDVIFALQNLLENDSIIVKPNNIYAIKS